jgi:hypothetical protein
MAEVFGRSSEKIRPLGKKSDPLTILTFCRRSDFNNLTVSLCVEKYRVFVRGKVPSNIILFYFLAYVDEKEEEEENKLLRSSAPFRPFLVQNRPLYFLFRPFLDTVRMRPNK